MRTESSSLGESNDGKECEEHKFPGQSHSLGPKQLSMGPEKADAKTTLESRVIWVIVDVGWIPGLETIR